MAANTSAIYVLTGFGSPASFSTVNTDVTGASGSFATIVTGGTNGSLVTRVRFRAVTGTGAGTIIHLFHNSGGTRRNIGSVIVPPGVDPTKPGVVPWEGTWTNGRGTYPLKSGDLIDAAAISGTTTFVGIPDGGDY